MVGSVTLLLKTATLDRVLLILVAFAAGALLGGALFHMLPAAIAADMEALAMGASVAAGFTVFFSLEQFLHWHHCQQPGKHQRRPLTYLVLLGDGLHNFLGGLAIAGTFLIDIRLGIASWMAALAHEIPQELGDFAVLVHGGWSRSAALLFNFLSALTFLLGGLVSYALAGSIDVIWLIPFAAGNFIYIAASDLVPEVNRSLSFKSGLLHLAAFVFGITLMFLLGKVAYAA